MDFGFERGGGFGRQTDRSGDSQQDCCAVWRGFGNRCLQAVHEPDDNFVEAQMRPGDVRLASAARFESRDVEGDAFPLNDDAGVRGIAALFERRGKTPGDGCDGELFLLV